MIQVIKDFFAMRTIKISYRLGDWRGFSTTCRYCHDHVDDEEKWYRGDGYSYHYNCLDKLRDEEWQRKDELLREK